MWAKLQRAVLAGVLVLAALPTPAQTPAEAPPEQVAADQVVAVLGLAARGDDGREVGRIVDVLVDTAGTPRAAVIDVGGFLGMGNRKVAVDWAALHFAIGKQAVATLAIPSGQIKAAPAYDPAKPVEMVGLPHPQPGPPAPAAQP